MRTLFQTSRALVVASRRRFAAARCWWLVAAVLLAGCGMRTAIQAEADAPGDDDAALPDGGNARPCGFGLPCNPDDVGGRTCESLGLASGTVSCDPDTCNLDISDCGGGTSTPGQPGTVVGGPGTPGLFGTAGAAGATGGLFGAGLGGLFGADGGTFFGGGDAGFFGAGAGADEDGGTAPGTFGGLFGGGGAN